jgi:Flp pilus assembly protein TadD
VRRLGSLALVGPALAVAVGGSGCASYQGARLYGSGSAALGRGDAPRAITDLERAAELVPHASEVQNHLGLAYLAAGRPQEARAAFERALALDCDNAAARANLWALERGAAARPAGAPAGAR